MHFALLRKGLTRSGFTQPSLALKTRSSVLASLHIGVVVCISTMHHTLQDGLGLWVLLFFLCKETWTQGLTQAEQKLYAARLPPFKCLYFKIQYLLSILGQFNICKQYILITCTLMNPQNFVIRQSPFTLSKLALNSQCSPGRPQTSHFPASASSVTGIPGMYHHAWSLLVLVRIGWESLQ